jgi:hypothetical protein
VFDRSWDVRATRWYYRKRYLTASQSAKVTEMEDGRIRLISGTDDLMRWMLIKAKVVRTS